MPNGMKVTKMVTQAMKDAGLDKYWELTRIKCPMCRRFLFYDTHEKKDATHFCLNCGGILLVFNSAHRVPIKEGEQ